MPRLPLPTSEKVAKDVTVTNSSGVTRRVSLGKETFPAEGRLRENKGLAFPLGLQQQLRGRCGSAGQSQVAQGLS